MDDYTSLKRTLAAGWNTWNTRSVLSHVILPQGFALNLGIKEYRSGGHLRNALIGRQGEDDESIHPGPHAYDGSYTELNLKWRGIELTIQSAHDGNDLVLLVTPLANQIHPATVTAEAVLLWNRPGHVCRDADSLRAELPGQTITCWSTAPHHHEVEVESYTPYLACTLDGPVGFSTGAQRTLAEVQRIITEQKARNTQRIAAWGDLSELYNAVQTCMAWDTIYEPKKDRVISTVSRLWNVGSGGYSMFCWDNYFAGLLAGLDNKGIAYSNVIEMTREATPDGFVPNCAHSTFNSLDRSQPPVGSLAVKELYRKYGDRWLLADVFEDLLAWNRWWVAVRQNPDGLLSWGSTPYEPRVGQYWETAGVNDTFGGALESGLDNSPMYDDIPFDKERHQMMLSDVGLNGLYVMDCRALAEIARVLDRTNEAEELAERGDEFAERIKTLWDEESGFCLNRRTDTGEFSQRVSPTNFYSLLAGSLSQPQAKRMIKEHFYNPDEFWGDWIMPSISRNDPAYPDQTYWRGRIWAPMNFLVYLGFRNYDLPQARQDLSEKSADLLLKEWQTKGHVHENYCPDSGDGCNAQNSDRFYHWGGLLGLIPLMEHGVGYAPEAPLR